jgi:hypothetical protein
VSWSCRANVSLQSLLTMLLLTGVMGVPREGRVELCLGRRFICGVRMPALLPAADGGRLICGVKGRTEEDGVPACGAGLLNARGAESITDRPL